MGKQNGRHKTKSDQDDHENQDPIPTGPQFQMELPWHHELNRAPLRIARDMYLKEYVQLEISLKTGVPPSVLMHRVRHWSKLKARLDEKLITDIRAGIVAPAATDIMKKGARVINLYLDRLLKRGTELKTIDIKLTSDIIRNLHSIKQLEEGKPTNITHIDKMTDEEAMNYLRELQKESVAKHEMSMFAPDSEETEEKLLETYKNGDNSGIH